MIDRLVLTCHIFYRFVEHRSPRENRSRPRGVVGHPKPRSSTETDRSRSLPRARVSMRRSRMRASELQFRCVGTVVGAFLFATLLTLSLHSPSPDAVVFSDDQHHAPVVEDGECAGFGRSNPLLPAPSGALSLFSLGDWGVRGLSVGSDAQMAVARGMKCAARAAPVSAVFTLGDNFYGNGVASADDPQFEFKWASVYTDAALDLYLIHI